MQQIKNAIDFYSKSYENIILIGDFNVEISDSHMDSFCAIYHLKSLIKEPTCYKNPEKPTCIDLILTNSPRQFQATLTLETGLSDFHKMTVATFKSKFPIIQKSSPKDLSAFKNIVLKALNLHAPLKTKYLRANHSGS